MVDNIKMDLKEIECVGCRMDCTVAEQGPIASTYEHRHELSSSIITAGQTGRKCAPTHNYKRAVFLYAHFGLVIKPWPSLLWACVTFQETAGFLTFGLITSTHVLIVNKQ
jgi:hypothetical protein